MTQPEITVNLPTLDAPLATISPDELTAFGDQAVAMIETACDEKTLQEFRVNLTGKKAALTALSKQMGSLDADAKKQYGAYLHDLRTRIGSALDAKAQSLAAAAMNAKLASEQVDITMPARGATKGTLHPLPSILVIKWTPTSNQALEPYVRYIRLPRR